MPRTNRKIPTGWEDYKPIGSLINGTRIFAFKTPLKLDLQKHVVKRNQFTTAHLIRTLEAQGLSLGLVVNCSNTRRYYDKSDIENINIKYRELLCPGRGFLVRSDIAKDFFKIIEDFSNENKDNELLIGVHCGDGINRSGYLICNYLICQLGFTSHEALNAFESARDYPIQRGSYIQALHKADSDRRYKNICPSNSDKPHVGESKKQQHFKRKLINEAEASSSSNSEPAAQIMQRLFQIEHQFKQVAESTFVNSSSIGALDAPKTIQSSETYKLTHHITPTQATLADDEYREYADDDAEDLSETEDEVNEEAPMNINYESMGRVDAKEPLTKSQQRRQRRQKREKIFTVMKKGRFWEINEMQNQIKK